MHTTGEAAHAIHSTSPPSPFLAGCLSCGIASVLLEGSPVAPDPLRWAKIIQRHSVTVFKAGSTFLRGVMAKSNAGELLDAIDTSSLRVGTFCAEPVAPAVQEFATRHICPR